MPARLFSDEQEIEIARQYTSRLSDGTWLGATELARVWNTNHRTIYSVLRRRGIKTRDAKEAHAHGKACRPIKNLPAPGELPPLCKCGCGDRVMWNPRKNRWNLYVVSHYRGDAEFKDEAWLRRQYIDQGKSAREIGEMVGAGAHTILHWLRRFNIPRRDVVAAHKGLQAGAKNPAWKGGVTPERQRFYKTSAWKELVKSVFKRDNYHCVRCGRDKTQGRKLHAHHIKSWASYPDLRFTSANLITLCDECHVWVHSLENTSREFIG